VHSYLPPEKPAERSPLSSIDSKLLLDVRKAPLPVPGTTAFADESFKAAKRNSFLRGFEVLENVMGKVVTKPQKVKEQAETKEAVDYRNWPSYVERHKGRLLEEIKESFRVSNEEPPVHPYLKGPVGVEWSLPLLPDQDLLALSFAEVVFANEPVPLAPGDTREDRGRKRKAALLTPIGIGDTPHLAYYVPQNKKPRLEGEEGAKEAEEDIDDLFGGPMDGPPPPDDLFDFIRLYNSDVAGFGGKEIAPLVLIHDGDKIRYIDVDHKITMRPPSLNPVIGRPIHIPRMDGLSDKDQVHSQQRRLDKGLL